MKTLQLSKGKTTIIDDADFKLVAAHKWYFLNCGYAARSIKHQGKHSIIYLHRFLLAPIRRQVCDHINGNKLDNRRSNLRVCTQSQNCKNRRSSSANTSGFKGVYFDKSRNLWASEITVDYKKKYLGRFRTAKLAAKQYNEAAINCFGQFAQLNSL